MQIIRPLLKLKSMFYNDFFKSTYVPNLSLLSYTKYPLNQNNSDPEIILVAELTHIKHLDNIKTNLL
jgi:hypothetical protein